jgi:hypothetical protein
VSSGGIKEFQEGWSKVTDDLWNSWQREADIKLNVSAWKTSWKIIKKEQAMQRQFTIEIRVDCPDEDKLESFREVIRGAGQLVYSNAQLLGSQTKPQIAIYSDDFFDGHKEIDLFQNRVQEGLTQLEAAGDTTQEEQVSDELLAAVTGKTP